jgi:hypothetical protein
MNSRGDRGNVQGGYGGEKEDETYLFLQIDLRRVTGVEAERRNPNLLHSSSTYRDTSWAVQTWAAVAHLQVHTLVIFWAAVAHVL